MGDWAQLGSIDAGGAFSLLVSDRGEVVPELRDVRRFREPWEREASLGLRRGDEVAVDRYLEEGRIVEGDRARLLEGLYGAWKADIAAGKSSLMIASDAGTVHELNERARADRVAAGVVSENGVRLENGQEAGVGDEIFTRQNERRLVAGSRWVKNGDHFLVTATNNDGSLSVRSISRGGELRLPAAYVVEHVELAYATTAFRAQGRTVETAHALVSPSTTREVLYVAATRGHECNQLYVDTHFDPDPSTGHDGPVPRQSLRARVEQAIGQHHEHGVGQRRRLAASTDGLEVRLEAEAREVRMTGGDSTETRTTLAGELTCLEPVALGVGAKGVDDPVQLPRGAQLADLSQTKQRAVGVLAVFSHRLDERQILVALVAPPPHGLLDEHATILQHCNSDAVDVSPLHRAPETAISQRTVLVRASRPSKSEPDPSKSGPRRAERGAGEGRS